MSPEVILDFNRLQRIGLDEAIFCQGKTPAQLTSILDSAESESMPLLLTRLSVSQYETLEARHRNAIDYDEVSRTALKGPLRAISTASKIALITAGSSDIHVTREVERTLRHYGHASTLVTDVGVAGLWRLIDKLEVIRAHPICIVIAGMDAALPTVVGGLVGGVVIGVPTSNGYGVATGGTTALHSMLASCAPGVSVMNIDNGYGAACAAIRVLISIDAVAKGV